MGRNPISHTLTVKALKEEISSHSPLLTQNPGGGEKGCREAIVRKSTNLAKRQGAVARQKGEKPQKVPTNTKVWKNDGGASAL